MRQTVLTLSSLATAVTLVASCKAPTNISTTAYIIGTDDIKPVTSENKKSISLLQLGSSVVIATHIDGSRRKFCSGTLIVPAEPGGTARILTNHHCFAPTEEDKRNVSSGLLPGHCKSTKVYFGFIKGEIDQVEVGECQEGTFRNDFEGDLAVFTLKAQPSAKFIPARIWSQDTIPNGRKARVVHYPTVDDKADMVFVPSAGINLPLAQVTAENCLSQGTFPESEWALDKSLPMGVKHTCDLKKGSSGSALWDVETDVVLGVNWGGIALKYKDPERTEVSNVATRAAYVRSFLEGRVAEEKTKIQDQSDQRVAADSKIEGKGKTSKTVLKGCGVVGSGLGSTLAMWLLMSLAVPLALLRSRS